MARGYNVIRKCDICGEPFPAFSSTSKYCSEECRRIAKRKAERDFYWNKILHPKKNKRRNFTPTANREFAGFEELLCWAIANNIPEMMAKYRPENAEQRIQQERIEREQAERKRREQEQEKEKNRQRRNIFREL